MVEFICLMELNQEKKRKERSTKCGSQKMYEMEWLELEPRTMTKVEDDESVDISIQQSVRKKPLIKWLIMLYN